jgi:hypothetical protein
MAADYRCRGTQWPPDPVGQTFRAGLGLRVLLIIAQAAIPASLSILIWAPVSGRYYLPKAVSLLITAIACALWFALARRAWRESATVGPDVIVVRNVLRCYRVPVANVTGLRFGGGNSPQLRSTQQMRLTASLADTRGGGRHGAQQAISVGAGRLGTAYWSGRRTAADDLADAITLVAGLACAPARGRVISARAAGIMAAAGLALLAVSVTGASLGHGSGNVLTVCHGVARALMYITWVLLLPSVCLVLDRLAVLRGQKSRSMPSSMPRIES